jgi:hypothetical protein
MDLADTLGKKGAELKQRPSQLQGQPPLLRGHLELGVPSTPSLELQMFLGK